MERNSTNPKDYTSNTTNVGVLVAIAFAIPVAIWLTNRYRPRHTLVHLQTPGAIRTVNTIASLPGISTMTFYRVNKLRGNRSRRKRNLGYPLKTIRKSQKSIASFSSQSSPNPSDGESSDDSAENGYRRSERPSQADPEANNGQTSCPVCLEAFRKRDRVRMLPCSHIYHPRCIDPWLSRSGTSCPLWYVYKSKDTTP